MNIRNQVQNYLNYCSYRKELDEKTVKKSEAKRS